MTNYEEARVKLANTHLNKLKSAGENNTGLTLKKQINSFKMKNYLMNFFYQQDNN